MGKNEFISEYSTVVDFSKDFKAIASYFLITENPNLEGLNTYVGHTTSNPEFKLWEFLRSYGMTIQNNDKFTNNLEGFFKYLGIEEMENFIQNRIGQQLLNYLKNNYNIRVYKYSSNLNLYSLVKFTCSDTKIYLYHMGGNYNSLDLKYLLNRLVFLNKDILEIHKIEKEIDGEWIPVIIKENGIYYNLSKFIG